MRGKAGWRLCAREMSADDPVSPSASQRACVHWLQTLVRRLPGVERAQRCRKSTRRKPSRKDRWPFRSFRAPACVTTHNIAMALLQGSQSHGFSGLMRPTSSAPSLRGLPSHQGRARGCALPGRTRRRQHTLHAAMDEDRLGADTWPHVTSATAWPAVYPPSCARFTQAQPYPAVTACTGKQMCVVTLAGPSGRAESPASPSTSTPAGAPSTRTAAIQQRAESALDMMSLAERGSPAGPLATASQDLEPSAVQKFLFPDPEELPDNINLPVRHQQTRSQPRRLCTGAEHPETRSSLSMPGAYPAISAQLTVAWRGPACL